MAFVALEHGWRRCHGNKREFQQIQQRTLMIFDDIAICIILYTVLIGFGFIPTSMICNRQNWMHLSQNLRGFKQKHTPPTWTAFVDTKKSSKKQVLNKGPNDLRFFIALLVKIQTSPCGSPKGWPFEPSYWRMQWTCVRGVFGSSKSQIAIGGLMVLRAIKFSDMIETFVNNNFRLHMTLSLRVDGWLELLGIHLSLVECQICQIKRRKTSHFSTLP